MPPQDPYATETSAIMSFKNFGPPKETRAKAKARIKAEAGTTDSGVIPPDHGENRAHAEDQNMIDVMPMRSSEAPMRQYESVERTRSLTLVSALDKESGEHNMTGTPDVESQAEQHRSLVIPPKSNVTDPKATHQLETEIEDLKRALQSAELKNRKLKERVVPTLPEIKPQAAFYSHKPNDEKLEHLKQQVAELKGRVKTSDQKANFLQSQMNEAARELEGMNGKIDVRDERIHLLELCVKDEGTARQRFEIIRSLTREKDDLVQRSDVLTRDWNDLVRQYNGQLEAYQRLDKRHMAMRGRLQDLQKKSENRKDLHRQLISDNKALKERLEQQELRVTKAQNAAMSVLSQSLSAALPDDRIRARFSELFEAIAEWARDNAAPLDHNALAHPDNISRMQENGLLRRIGTTKSGANLDFDFHDDTAVDTLLNTALTRHLCQTFIQDPFWFAQDSSPVMDVSLPRNERLDTDAVLGQMLGQMFEYHDGNEAIVHAWRASTVQILTGTDQARKNISAFHKRYLEDELLPHCKEFIRDPLPQADLDELMVITESLGSFAIELWSQKPSVHCLHLRDEDWKYRQAHELLEIARAVGIEDNDSRLDGRLVPVLVQPLIVGFGTHDGKDYDKYKVWSKAVVWVSKDEERIIPFASDTAERKGFLGKIFGSYQS